MVQGIIMATLLIGLVGLFVGVFLGVAGIKFKVETDPREEAVLRRKRQELMQCRRWQGIFRLR